MRLVYVLAIFVSAALLFLVQPMLGKVLLPRLGGSPSVWNTCMVFYQAVLLLGYLYAHVLARLPRAAQAIIHAGVMGAGALLLPMPVDVGAATGNPAAWTLRTLAAAAGLPFFVVCTTSPLLQSWYSRLRRTDSADPYWLYAASNAGSSFGLLAFPLLAEPLLSRGGIAALWAGAYWALLTPLVLAGAGALLVRGGAPAAPGPAPAAPREPLSWRRRARWILLAVVPSALVLGVTQHITTNIAPVPLLWVAPLFLYLVTFMLAFVRRPTLTARAWGRALPFGVLLLAVVLINRSLHPAWVIIPLHLAAFFLAAMMCHARLAEDRPHASRLTDFYLCLSIGGVIGGATTALLAPHVFDRITEYPLALGLACFLRPQMADRGPASRTTRYLRAFLTAIVAASAMLSVELATARGIIKGDWLPGALRAGAPVLLCAATLLHHGSLRFASGAAAILVLSQYSGYTGETVHQQRTFFGVYRVESNVGGKWHRLFHGTTLHGMQARFSPEDAVPATYYHPTGPLGDTFKLLRQRGEPIDAALIGLGVGSAARYAAPGDTFTFIEIDPAVVRIARDPSFFTYLQGSRANIRIDIADGRLGVAALPPASLDLVVIDAFSSDAIPIHLITREAVQTYFSRLRPHGVAAFHVSNQYFDLYPVLGRIAHDLGLLAIRRNDDVVTSDLTRVGKLPSEWVLLARDKADFGSLAILPAWDHPRKPTDPPPRGPLWTDDYSNVLSAFK